MHHNNSRGVIEVDSDDDFETSHKSNSAVKARKEGNSKRSRCLKHVPTKLLEIESQKAATNKTTLKNSSIANSSDSNNDSKNVCENSWSSLDSHNESNSMNPENSSLDRNTSVLEKSSLYFGPGGTDPRIKAIAAKTKNSLNSCDAEVKEIASKKESTEAIWQHYYDFVSSMEGEEEIIDDWEDDWIVSFDKENRLLDDDSDSSSDDIEIVDENDEFERSAQEASGPELASWLTGYNSKLKSELSNRSKPKENCLMHISGTISTNLCQGQYSNYENKMTVKVLGLDLSFSREYLDKLRAMTGFDLRHSAYKIHFAVTENGSSTTVKILNESGELRNFKKLNNTSLVNESVSSELNISLRTKRLLKMFTPKREVKLEGHDNSVNSTLQTSAELNRSRMVKRTISMLTPRKAKIEEVKKMKSEPSGSLNDSVASTGLNRSERLLRMLTPRKPKVEEQAIKQEKIPVGSGHLDDSTLNRSTLSKSTLLERTMRMVTPRHLKVKVETDRQAPYSTLELPLLKVSPDFERCKSNPSLPHTVTSPMKRNHDQSLNLTHSESPSKRLRFNDESVLSSTRIDDSICDQREPNGHFIHPSSSGIHSVHQHQSMSRSHVLPPYEYNRNPGATFANSTGCIGPCCQAKLQHCDNSYNNHHQHHNQHHYNQYQHFPQQQLPQPQPPQRYQQHPQQQHFPQQYQQQPSYHDPTLIHHNNIVYSRPQCSGPCCVVLPHNISIPPSNTHPGPMFTTTGQRNHSAQESASTGLGKRQVLAHCQQSRSPEKKKKNSESRLVVKSPKKEDVSESRLVVPKKNSAGIPGVQIPVVTELLKGLNSSKRKLKINVAYDVKLDDSEELENSF